MPIFADDLHLYAAERMTDLDNGGGLPSGTRILDGADNAVFPDIASGDRIAGRTFARKLFAAVPTDAADTLLAARVYLSSLPGDPDVSYALLDTGAYADQRAEMLEHLYTAAQQDSNTNLRLYQTYYAGDSSIVLYAYTNQTTPVNANWLASVNVGTLLCLEDGENRHYLRITDLSRSTVGTYQTLNLAFTPPLAATFQGGFNSATTYVTPTQIYTTRATSVLPALYGITTLAVGAAQGEYRLRVAEIDVPIAPTLTQIFEGSFTGSTTNLPVTKAVAAANSRLQSTTLDPMPDLSAITVRYPGGALSGATSPGLFTVAGTTISVLLPSSPVQGRVWYHTPATTVTTTETAALRWGRPVMPGSVRVAAFLASNNEYHLGIDDSEGAISETEITGTVDYETGAVDLTFAHPVTLGTATLRARAPETRIYWPGYSGQLLSHQALLSNIAALDSFQISVQRVSDNALLSATSDGSGMISGTGISGTIDSNGWLYLTFPDAVYLETLRVSYSAFTELTKVLGYDYVPLATYSTTLPLTSGALVPGSFTITGQTYPEAEAVSATDDGEGVISGTGISGTINYSTGELSLTFTTDLLRSSLRVAYQTLTALGNILWEYATQATGTDFTVPLPANLTPGALTVQAATVADATLLTGADDGEGVISGADLTGTVDYGSGQVTLTFTEAVTSSSLQLLYRYTAPTAVTPTLSDSLDWLRIPASRAFPMLRPGDGVRLQHPLGEALPNPVTPSAVYPLSRSAVSQIWLEDTSGIRLPTALYQVDLLGGIVTMASSLDLSMYTQPLIAWHSIEEEAVVITVDANNRQLELDHELRHAFPAHATYVSGLVPLGDLSAALSVPFSQQAWTSVWADTRIGNPITPQFNQMTYPITVTNSGALTERWRIQFTGTTTVDVIGETVGQIATGLSTTGDIAPINPRTNAPYFTIPSAGWGAGWVSGHLLRFNTTAAHAPFWILSCVQPGESPLPGTPDRFHITFTGDVDA